MNEKRKRNYILIDGALWKEDTGLATQSGTPHRSLYRGKPAEELNNVAPYLFYTSEDKEFEKWVNKRELKNPITRRTLRLTSELDIDELRKHLRRFLRVNKEDNGFLYFRFYDPKVSACTLPNLTPEQLNEFFSGINEVIHFSDVLREKKTYTYSAGELKMDIKSEYKI